MPWSTHCPSSTRSTSFPKPSLVATAGDLAASIACLSWNAIARACVLSSPQPREAALPLYYFHLHNGDLLRDETGEEFADGEAARQAAVRGISELIAEKIAAGEKVDLRHRMEIEDEQGRRTVIQFSELFDGIEPEAVERSAMRI